MAQEVLVTVLQDVRHAPIPPAVSGTDREASHSNRHKVTICDTTWGNPDPCNTTEDVTGVQDMRAGIFHTHKHSPTHLETRKGAAGSPGPSYAIGDITRAQHGSRGIFPACKGLGDAARI